MLLPDAMVLHTLSQSLCGIEKCSLKQVLAFGHTFMFALLQSGIVPVHCPRPPGLVFHVWLIHRPDVQAWSANNAL